MCVADFFVLDDFDPSAFAGGFTWSGVDAFEPGDEGFGFWLVEFVVDTVVVGEGDVEGV